ncbi:hypothetical protein NDI54_15345 [Haloarcula sp. S1AR25-5A]|uniref:Uncharacterized protein n=1 Tax=Haloarcula terrestris TaxID=2950533 RepID=A0AAE4EYY7_9EURY|nr:hypothetical protein [Haloarcula terrestris]MDS0222720.1 hypothetical protein [Haloarcula terrestris]
MVPSTRRALLYGACGLATTIAGCSGLFESSTESTRTAAGDDGSTAPVTGTETDPAAIVTRADTDRQPVWVEDDGRPTESHYSDRLESEVIDSASKADRITVTDDVDRSPIDAFLNETDFETETVYLQRVLVEECFRLTLCQISWTTDQISTDYGRVTRPYTDLCTDGNTVYAVWFIRIPEPINADEISSYSSSISGSACDSRVARADSEGGSMSASAEENQTKTDTAVPETGGEGE